MNNQLNNKLEEVDLATATSLLKSLEENNYDYEVVARNIKVSVITLKNIDVILNKKHSLTEEGLGPKHLQQYIIARRHVDDQDGWNNKDPKIVYAREAYNRGEVELMTGRDGNILNLYLIPRVTKGIKRNYFDLEKE